MPDGGWWNRERVVASEMQRWMEMEMEMVDGRWRREMGQGIPDLWFWFLSITLQCILHGRPTYIDRSQGANLERLIGRPLDGVRYA